MADLLPGGPLAPIYWGYMREWWPYRDDENVLLLHYTNVRKDLKGSIKKIAKFLDVNLSAGELNTVTKRCSIDHMKKVDAFNYLMPLNRDRGWDNSKDHVIKTGKLVGKGGIKTGSSMFSDKVKEMWRKAEEDELGSYDPALLEWAREGGDFPPVE